MNETKGYRQAGELFGYLCERLTFGEVSMTKTDGEGAGGPLLAYYWTFNSSKGRFSLRYVVRLEMLAPPVPIEALGRVIVDEWRAAAQGKAVHGGEVSIRLPPIEEIG